jgi:hypothetical protein
VVKYVHSHKLKWIKTKLYLIITVWSFVHYYIIQHSTSIWIMLLYCPVLLFSCSFFDIVIAYTFKIFAVWSTCSWNWTLSPYFVCCECCTSLSVCVCVRACEWVSVCVCECETERFVVAMVLMLGSHGDILEIRVENIAEVIANCLCVNRVNSSVAGIL